MSGKLKNGNLAPPPEEGEGYGDEEGEGYGDGYAAGTSASTTPPPQVADGSKMAELSVHAKFRRFVPRTGLLSRAEADALVDEPSPSLSVAQKAQETKEQHLDKNIRNAHVSTCPHPRVADTAQC